MTLLLHMLLDGLNNVCAKALLVLSSLPYSSLTLKAQHIYNALTHCATTEIHIRKICSTLQAARWAEDCACKGPARPEQPALIHA